MEVAVLLVALAVAAVTAAVLVPAADAAAPGGPAVEDGSAGAAVDADRGTIDADPLAGDADADSLAADADRAAASAPADSGVANDTGTANAAQPALIASDVAVAPGEQATLELALSAVPDGLSGYQLTLELSPDARASVVDASYPEAFGHTSTPAVGPASQSVTLEAVDLHDAVSAGDGDVTLATVDVRGEDAGETTASVTELQADADGGARIDPPLESGTIQVGADAPAESGGSPASSAAAGDGDAVDAGAADDGESDDASTRSRSLAPANLAVVVAVALAMLLTVVITRRR